MNRTFFFCVFLFIGLFLTHPSRASAQIDRCSVRCEVDGDCGSGYRCFVGVCRLEACPAVANCQCSAVATSTVTTKKSTPQPVKKTIATHSASLEKSPRTGANEWILAFFALFLLLVGVGISKLSIE